MRTTAGERICTEATAGKRIPGATYRLQFNPHFTFRHARDAAQYLSELGITDCYCSPLFKAGLRSAHGYDVCRFDEINPDLGGAEGFELFSTELNELGLGLLLDIVPNHMAVDACNDWWMDVLQNGPNSEFASYFDIDWRPAYSSLSNQIVLPILGEPYVQALESGQIKLVLEGGHFLMAYHDRRFPISLNSYEILLREIFDVVAASGAATWEARKVKLLLSTILGKRENDFRQSNLEVSGPGPNETDAGVTKFGRSGAVTAAPPKSGARQILLQINAELESLRRRCIAFRTALESTLGAYHGTPGLSGTFDKLEALLRKQFYRLTYWKVAAEEISYRRFFDVTDLIALRMERQEVFEACHQKVFQWIREEKVTGLRLDHIDGLWNPKAYCARLHQISPRPVYVVVEKILAPDEQLSRDWLVDGTTGYDFLNRLNGLFVSSANAKALVGIYHEFTERHPDFNAVANSSKAWVLQASFRGEVDQLAHQLKQIAQSIRLGQDFTLRQLRQALVEIIA